MRASTPKPARPGIVSAGTNAEDSDKNDNNENCEEELDTLGHDK
jgi:hypothetical protein